jgi:hypothetical protein
MKGACTFPVFLELVWKAGFISCSKIVIFDLHKEEITVASANPKIPAPIIIILSFSFIS